MTHSATHEHADVCPERNALVPLLFAIYMMMSNVLLLNLLIAMFRYADTNETLLDKYGELTTLALRVHNEPDQRK